MEKNIDKPPIIGDSRVTGKKKVKIYNLLIAAIVTGVLVYHGFILKELLRDEGIAWDREGNFYKKIRDKDLYRLSALSQRLENLSKEKIEIERHLGTLLSEKDMLEKEKKKLLDSFQETRAQAQETLKKKEQEFKVNLSREYESEIAAFKERAAESDKFKEELQIKKADFQRVAEEMELKNEEIKKFKEKNKKLLDSLVKANQSNIHFMKKTEDLQKIRDELEEELRRKNLLAE